MQKQILEEEPELEVAVYAVWFGMVPGDERGAWPPRLLDDPRVRHWWDEEKRVGRWYGSHPDYGDDPNLVIWDTYFLYGAGSSWEETGPSHLESWGYTVLETREKLRRDLLRSAAGSRGRDRDGR